MTHVDEFDLRDAARNLADAYAKLEELKWAKQETKLARKMEPTFGPGSPTPDRDWSLNLEVSLLKETTDENTPGGLLVMAIDALSYTSAAGRAHEVRGGMICAYIYRNAYEICEKFPAASELLELMREQDKFIWAEVGKRIPREREQARVEPRHNSTVICAIMAQHGYTITPQHLHTWSERGKISRQYSGRRVTYLISEVLEWATRTTQNQKRI